MSLDCTSNFRRDCTDDIDVSTFQILGVNPEFPEMHRIARMTLNKITNAGIPTQSSKNSRTVVKISTEKSRVTEGRGEEEKSETTRLIFFLFLLVFVTAGRN